MVIMVSWKDRFTCVTYRSSGPWRAACLAHLADLVADRLAEALRGRNPCTDNSGVSSAANSPAFELANALARFWSEEYYELLFPLRLGLAVQRDSGGGVGDIQWRDPFGQSAGPGDLVDLDSVLRSYDSPAKAFRTRRLEENKLAPILPLQAGTGPGAQEDLLPERLLVGSLIAGCTVRHALANGEQDHQSERGALPLRHDAVSTARLGILASPFLEPEAGNSEGSKRIAGILHTVPGAFAVASFIAGISATQDGIPEPVWELLPALRAWLGGETRSLDLPKQAAEIQMRFIVAAPQRIQHYIFESPGLKEIRGASVLLDHTIGETIREDVVRENGHEAVVRCAASTIEFLSMVEGPVSDSVTWRDLIKRKFYDNVGPVWVAVGEAAATLRDVVQDWRSISSKAWNSLQEDRNKAEVAAIEILPFEARCDKCRLRPASKRFTDQDGLGWICDPCDRKIDASEKWAGRRVSKLLSDLGISARELLQTRNAETQDGKVHSDTGELPRSLDDLPAENARYKHNAVIFGDGNNFGGMVQKLDGIPATIQWSQRVAAITKAAAGLALAMSIVEDRRRGAQYKYMPFEVLTLGGDDMSFITAGTLALPLTRHLLELTDAEFKMPATPATVCPFPSDANRKPVSFSFGVVICDSKAPIRIVSEWAEEQAMKQAKGKVRNSKEPSPKGTVAFVIANSLDNLPSGWDAYTRELTRTVVPLGKLKNRDNAENQCFVIRSVMQPLDESQLSFLLDMANELRKHQSLVQSLAVAFRNCSPHGAILHYLYQKGRARGTERWKAFELLEDRDHGRWQCLFGGNFPWNAPTGCETVEPFTELVQIMKATQLKGGGDER